MAKCTSCVTKKGKRNCPALGGLICPQCCGTKKEKEIDCSPDCFYLGKSKQYFTDRQEGVMLSDFEREMKSVIGDEEQYMDILQNIEFIIHRIYRERGNFTDKHVETALEYLLEMGKAQLDLPAKFLTEPPPNVRAIVDGINDIFEFRESLRAREHLLIRLKCIYQVLDSVRMHRNPTDDSSYLKFASQFLR